ncbi:tRNA1(Val) (adenine(37)-N6)-methyltransferase [Mucilaginibacter glaciei]|uniref:tRNA1(Val) (adenine(37)-N6)-methyltransferase n=1 Tax=Mucilaginibacter glaciei TaxID=2772109 RepID=A0A926NH97_9SPHI|nr:methyltransferase [Mucilaginibacter glaciei]MBD1392054.1 methyltransferase [Mucilaginibacter glaciei]
MSVFKFKQFEVDQSGCAMKINTDGVLLGAMAEAIIPSRILDIGTGTGVIALMLAQRFPNALIDAVEIDEVAAETAQMNFKKSPFAGRMLCFAMGFEAFFEEHPTHKYDLIISNPPFFLNSLESPGATRNLARHTDFNFYNRLINSVSQHLSELGTCQLVLPLTTAKLVKELLASVGLHLQKQINIRSFPHDEPHREILIICKKALDFTQTDFVIYSDKKVYSSEYQNLLKEFFTIF